jgi:uncharacterized protein YbbK (DUF523 family)
MVSCITFVKKKSAFLLLNSPMCGIDDTKVYTVVFEIYIRFTEIWQY